MKGWLGAMDDTLKDSGRPVKRESLRMDTGLADTVWVVGLYMRSMSLFTRPKTAPAKYAESKLEVQSDGSALKGVPEAPIVPWDLMLLSPLSKMANEVFLKMTQVPSGIGLAASSPVRKGCEEMPLVIP